MSTVVCESDQVSIEGQDIVEQFADMVGVIHHQHAPFVAHQSSPNMHDACIFGAKKGRNN